MFWRGFVLLVFFSFFQGSVIECVELVLNSVELKALYLCAGKRDQGRATLVPMEGTKPI